MDLSDFTKNGDNYVFGWLGYTNQKTYDRICMLKKTDQGCNLIIPLNVEEDEIYRWFVDENGEFNIDGSDLLPKHIWLDEVTTNEKYCLVGNIATNIVISIGTRRCWGQITSDYVVKGVEDGEYSSINGVRCLVPEYFHWSGLPSMSSNSNVRDGFYGSVEPVSTESKDVDSVEIGAINDVQLSFRRSDSFQTHHRIIPEIIKKGGVSFETYSSNKIPFDEHMKYQNAMTALISILCWRDVSYEKIFILNEEETNETLDGIHYNSIYHPIITDRYSDWIEPKNNRPYLINFKDVNSSGLLEWFKLMQKYESPLIGISHLSRMHEHMSLRNQVSLFCVAFEELDAIIRNDANIRNQPSTAKRIERIINDTVLMNGEPIYTDSSMLSSHIANTYNSIKHPKKRRGHRDREYWLDSTNLYMVVQLCRSITLVWIAGKLGCSTKMVDSIKHDYYMRDYITDWLVSGHT